MSETPSTPPPPPPSGSPAIGFQSALQPSSYQGPPPTKDETNMAMLMYILAIFTSFLGPLIVWLIKKDQSRFIDDQGKEILNFQITFVVFYIVCMVLFFLIIPIFIAMLAGLAALVFTIIGAVKVSGGVAYRYPFAVRLLK